MFWICNNGQPFFIIEIANPNCGGKPRNCSLFIVYCLGNHIDEEYNTATTIKVLNRVFKQLPTLSS